MIVLATLVLPQAFPIHDFPRLGSPIFALDLT